MKLSREFSSCAYLLFIIGWQKMAGLKCLSFVDYGTDTCSQILRYRIFMQSPHQKTEKRL